MTKVRQQYPHPDTQKNLDKPQMRLWIKFQYGKSRRFENTVVLKNYLNEKGTDRKAVAAKLIRLAYKYILRDLIWQARIFEHPGNEEIWNWKQYKDSPEIE